ncbi:hypothetical protein [Mesoaciditoga lauensis]|uniref:hypothetical protein n=1 Tax=Mesoaciditoga lauensis TaxID=1495039 RepID=UPI000560EC79|nr:hypothetical protein [Mesoaciditoga lauensis]
MTDQFEKEIIDRLARIETSQEAMENQNKAEHQQIISAIEELKNSSDKTKMTNGTQNERLIHLETEFQNHIKEEQREKSAFMWRFGIIITLIVFGGDIITKLLGM